MESKVTKSLNNNQSKSLNNNQEPKVTKSLNNNQALQEMEKGMELINTGTNFESVVLDKTATISASPCCDKNQFRIIVDLLQNIDKKLSVRQNANKIRAPARRKFFKYRQEKFARNLEKRRTVSTMTTEDKATQISSMSLIDNREVFNNPSRTSEDMTSDEVMKYNTFKGIQEIVTLFYEDRKKKVTNCMSVSAKMQKLKLGEKTEKVVTERDMFKNLMPCKCSGKFQHIRNIDTVCAFPLYEFSRNFDEFIHNELRSENPFNSSLEARSASNHGNVSSTPGILSASSQEMPAVEIPHSMNMEFIRLASFRNFPSSHLLSTITLARCGFFYTGENDKVACFACKATYSGWQEGNNPDEVHQRISPNCPLVSGEQNCNVPIGNGRDLRLQPRSQNTSTYVTEIRHQQSEHEQQSRQISAASANENTSTSEERATHPVRNYERPSGSGASSANANSTVLNSAIPAAPETYRGSDSSRAKQERINEIIRQLDPLGINFDRPKYPEYAVLATRISSFTDWPSSLRQTPRDLATAGFLYAGYGDYTRCFFCGGGLRNWEPDDDPWVEHARWFPKCAYVRQNKGDAFVALVQIEHKERESREAASGASNLDIQPPIYGNARRSSTNGNVPRAVSNSSCTAADVLSLSACQSVLEMGYSRDTVSLAFQTLQRTKDADEIHGEDLMDVILTNEERQNNHNETVSNQTSLSNSEISPANSSHKASGYSNAATEKEADDQSMELLSRQLDNTTLEDTRSLIEENRQLKNQRRCKICLEEDASIAMLPCGHLCCCPECAPAMRKCPICRQFVKGTVKTWLV